MNQFLLKQSRKALLSIALLISPAAFAQPTDMGGYSSMRIDSVGILEGGFDGTIKRMAEGVDITLLSADPEMKDLPIKAGTMSFDWPAGAATPSTIIMEGNVEIDHPQGHVTAQRAEWNFDAGTLTFSGNPIMRSEQLKEMRGEKMTLNFHNNSFQVFRAKIPEFIINNPGQDGTGTGGGAAGGTKILNEGEVTDWAGLVAAIKKEAASAGASPGKQIVSGLPSDKRALLNQATVEQMVDNKEMILEGINRALAQNSFYSEAAWEGKTLSTEAQELLAKEQRTPEEQQRLNRLLLQAAYPQYLATP